MTRTSFQNTHFFFTVYYRPVSLPHSRFDGLYFKIKTLEEFVKIKIFSFDASYDTYADIRRISLALNYYIGGYINYYIVEC